MNVDLEQRIEQSMVDRAARAGAVGFSADDVLRAGRAARSRQRRLGTLAVAAGVTVLALAATAVFTNNGGWTIRGTVPGDSTTTAQSPNPSPSELSTPTAGPRSGAAPASLKLSIAKGHTITPWNSGEISVNLPAALKIASGTHVPGGWVLEAYGDGEGFSVWFQPDAAAPGQAPTRISGLFGSSAISADGHTLVVSGGGGPNSSSAVVAYQLPSLTQFASTTFSGGTGALAQGVAGDWVLLSVAQGDGSPTVAASWNMVTGKITPADHDVDIWGFSDAGKVLLRVNGTATSCVDTASISQLGHIGRTGLCSAEVTGAGVRGALSPDGAQVAITRFDRPTVLVRTSDIHQGTWHSTELAGISSVNRWVNASSFLAVTPDGALQLCTTAATCTPVATPGGDIPVPILVDRGL